MPIEKATGNVRLNPIPYSGYYSRVLIFAEGGALCIARVIRGFKICGPYSPAVFREQTLFSGYILRVYFSRMKRIRPAKIIPPQIIRYALKSYTKLGHTHKRHPTICQRETTHMVDKLNVSIHVEWDEMASQVDKDS